MSKTRNNHYVPQWYQRGFLEDGLGKLKYIDLTPSIHTLRDGSRIAGKSLFDSTTAQCFCQTDLYSTFFGFDIDDEIERRLFGAIDCKGAAAVQAFKSKEVGRWIASFDDLFEFIDAQKLRTPKGLAWLQSHYPFLDQNQLMFEMQGVRMMNCTLWVESVKEVVSAEDSQVKFIVSDHPVTIYNYAVPPENPNCVFPNDPPIAWKATQTIYPLDRNLCLILSNLEYAKDPSSNDPCRKRTNARNFRKTLSRADACIRSRNLTDNEVCQINYAIKARANRFLAAGRQEWLFPERHVAVDWAAIAQTLKPPPDELWRFGGEIYVGYKDGRVEYQDEFGRSDVRAEFLNRSEAAWPRRPKDLCGCGSGKPFKTCCMGRAPNLRPSWTELSIRERNIMYGHAITKILCFDEGKDWASARRELTNEEISELYTVFQILWPLGTNITTLLPKPDGRLRALYTGLVDPRMITDYALGASSYFSEILIQNPFLHPGAVKDEFNPIKKPAQYRQQVIKDIVLLLDLMPLIVTGIINFFPDPCYFDPHLRSQMTEMAKARYANAKPPVTDPRMEWLQRDDFQRSLWSLSEKAQRSMIRKALPDFSPDDVTSLVATFKVRQERDPLAPLQAGKVQDGPDAGLLLLSHLVPNLEMSLYLAQATGAVIVTDSPNRWRELQLASCYTSGESQNLLPAFKAVVEDADYLFVADQMTLCKIKTNLQSEPFRSLMSSVVRVLSKAEKMDLKPNWESQLPKRFAAAHAALQTLLTRTGMPSLRGKLRCIMPSGGIRDNTINRLLLMSSVDHYSNRVAMAIYIKRPDPTKYP